MKSRKLPRKRKVEEYQHKGEERLNNSSAEGSWEFRSLDDIQRFSGQVRSVPGRTQGRKHHHEEQYSLGLYLLALGEHALLTFPLRIEQGESPDFMRTWPSGETTGLEVTRATTEDFQRTMTGTEKEFLRREAEAKAAGVDILPLPADQGVLLVPRAEAEPVCIMQGPLEGWAGEKPERKWCDQVLKAVRQKFEKLPKFRPASYHDLLINNDADVPLFGGSERKRALDTVAKALNDFNARIKRTFRVVSIILSLDVEYDIGGNRRLLPYRQNEAS